MVFACMRGRSLAASTAIAKPLKRAGEDVPADAGAMILIVITTCTVPRTRFVVPMGSALPVSVPTTTDLVRVIVIAVQANAATRTAVSVPLPRAGATSALLRVAPVALA